MNALFASNPTCCYTYRPSLRPSLRPKLYAPLIAPPLPSRNPKGGVRRIHIASPRTPKCAMDASIGGSYSYEAVPKFPRLNVWDPYKRLGVSRDASEEEIQVARNFLLEQYAGHERSMESIEAAYEKILMASFRERKKSKINLKSRLRKKVEESPPWFKTLIDYFEFPPPDIILRRFFLFAFMGIWSVTHSAETGPAFQVLLSLGSCIFFLNEKMKNLARASITGFVALVVGWVAGSILVPVIPSSLLQPTWSLELLTSLVCYVFLFISCTFLK